MSKMKKYHLKPFVKKLIILFILLVIIGFFIGRYLYKQHQLEIYHNSYEYKLIQLGYQEDYQLLLDTLSNDQLDVILTYPYNEFIPEFIQTKYFIFANLDEYLDQVITEEDDFFKYHGTEGYDYEEIVSEVNVHVNNDYYTGDFKTDLSKEYGMLVNKYYELGEDYIPDDLVDIDVKYYYGSKKQIRSEVYEAFKQMWEAAKEEGHYLVVISAYRSYQHQAETYRDYEERYGTKYADNIAARPGYSEHQTGLCLDIYSKTNTNKETFKDSETYNWLINNSYKYGFILRYPDGNLNIKKTGYNFESWHYRYVGVDLAKKVYESGLTYDEYYAYYIE